MSNEVRSTRSPFTTEETIKLIRDYGKAYWDPNLSDEGKKKVFKSIQQSFPRISEDALATKLNKLISGYNSVKHKDPSKIQWIYFAEMQSVMKKFEASSGNDENKLLLGKRGRPKSTSTTFPEP
jgi:hypothetical protein